jgi:hypothetical protein
LPLRADRELCLPGTADRERALLGAVDWVGLA